MPPFCGISLRPAIFCTWSVSQKPTNFPHKLNEYNKTVFKKSDTYKKYILSCFNKIFVIFLDGPNKVRNPTRRINTSIGKAVNRWILLKITSDVA